MDYKSMVNFFTSGMLEYSDYTVDLKPLSGRDMIEKGFAVVGSASTVREQLEALVKRLNVGHLMTVLQFGSMPHDLAMKNVEQFGREVLPGLQTIWQDKSWENPWWPTAAKGSVAA